MQILTGGAYSGRGRHQSVVDIPSGVEITTGMEIQPEVKV
jgi:NAD(P)H-hydrate repair Nnr-like enzyme with NAD(P)H-hydrate epimerase domain